MSDLRTIFQYVVLIIFGILGIVGVTLFALTRAGTGTNTASPIVIWGPPLDIGDTSIKKIVDEHHGSGGMLEGVTYEIKNQDTLYGELTEALASGNGPDLVVFDASTLLSLRDKIVPIPYTAYTSRLYQDTFVHGADIFTTETGVYALPILVDPLVLFWNKTMFASAGVAQVPQEWETFVRTVPKLTVIKNNTDVIQSGVAFGEYNNVLHAKEIVSALLLQAGVSIVTANNQGVLVSDVDTRGGTKNAELAIQFFTDFSNPAKTVYSWNKTFDRSREAFSGNKVAMYAGFVSEIPTLRLINPNISFDISQWPQSNTGSIKSTYGKFYGVAILKSAKNPQRAYAVAKILAGSDIATLLMKAGGMPSARRDVLLPNPNDPHSDVIIRSAIFARAWLQPGVSGMVTDTIFSRLINSVVSGSQTTPTALSTARQDLDTALRVYKNP